MRKLIFAIVPALAFSASARTLTPAEALARVQADPTLRKVAGKPLTNPLLKSTVNTQEGQPAVYLYNSGNQYMLLSASSEAEPLLGYGFAAPDSIEMPPQMKTWLESYAAAIQHAENSPQPELQSVVKAPARAEIKPLLSTTWDQTSPYNKFTPSKAPTGCVATAMAQVMKYHNYPESTSGTAYADYKGSRVSRSIAATYDWKNMLNSYSGTYSTSQANAVATLMVNAGYAASMYYNDASSSSTDQAMIKAMVETFKYSPAAWMHYRDHFTTEAWEDKLYTEIANKRPLYYSGSAAEGGHAFVCDGYQNGYFHFNWGWSGYYDGYFKIDALNPAGQGTGGYEGGYNTHQGALFNCGLPQAGDARPQVQLTMFAPIKATPTDTYLQLESEWYNYSYISAKLSIELSMRNVDTNKDYREVIADGYTFASGQGFRAFTIPMTTLPDGTYEVQLVSRENGFDDWMPVLHNLSYSASIMVTKKNGALTVSGAAEKEPEFANFRPNGQIVKDEVTSYSMSITNYSQNAFTQKISIGLMEATDKGYALVAITNSTYNKSVTVKAASTTEVSNNFKFAQYSGSFEFDKEKYIFVAYDPDQMNILAFYDQYVGVSTTAGTIEVTKATIKSPVLVNDSATYSVTISNSTAKTENVTMALAIANTGYEIVAMTGGETNSIAAKSTKTFNHQVAFAYINNKLINSSDEYIAVLVDPSTLDVFYKVGIVKIDSTSGIENVDNTAAQARYVDLLGRTVSKPGRGGLYIRVDRPAKLRFND